MLIVVLNGVTRACDLCVLDVTDLAPDLIRVNTLSPGTIETPGSHGHMRMVNLTVPQGRKQFGDSCFMKVCGFVLIPSDICRCLLTGVMVVVCVNQRQGHPLEVGAAAAFLAGDDSSFMTAAHVIVDAGGTAK